MPPASDKNGLSVLFTSGRQVWVKTASHYDRDYGVPACLFQRGFCIVCPYKGKPVERRGRKATGLKISDPDSGVASISAAYQRALPCNEFEGNSMNIVVFSKRWAEARHYELGHPLTVGLFAVAVVMLLGGAFLAGIQMRSPVAQSLNTDSGLEQQAQIHALRQQLDNQLAGLSARVGQVNAQMLRLNALGKRVSEMAHLDKSEFNFDAPPAQGGPEHLAGASAEPGAELHDVLASVEKQLESRERQLVMLETLISSRQLTRRAIPDGSPVPGAWISSPFGRRADPITGEIEEHSGIDLAAPSGALAYAVAPGVVTWAGNRSGYGELVEINHGNGFVTRYAHNSRVLVRVGDRVNKGMLISEVGSTGRSTGPHLHFEVLKDGQAINPQKFIAS